MKKRNNFLYFSVLYSSVIIIFLATAAVWGDTVTTIAEKTPNTDRKCIIIDPGHGGEDGGATSCAGILESKYNLEISLKLNDLLQMMGYNTKMIRTTDISIYTQGNSIAQKKVSDLKQRVNIANNTKNAYVISIHQNYFSDSRYSGTQVFYAPTGNSKELAAALQKQVATHIQKENKRTIKKASGIYLMEHIQCSGVLIECGFLSNQSEEAKLRDPSYQNDLCCVIATSLSNFLDREDVS